MITLAGPYVRRYGLMRGIGIALASRRAQWAAASGSLVTFRIPGLRYPFSVRAGTSDMAVFDQVVVNRELRGLAGCHPETIIDAGANIGASAVEFANMWPTARIVCLEVNSENLAVLRHNVAPYGNITVIPAGLWGSTARLDIVNQHADAYAFIVRQTEDGSIAGMSVLDVMATAGFDQVGLLKVDIEGSEIEVLDSSASWIRFVDHLVIELHDRFRDGCQQALDRALHRHPFAISKSGEYTVARRTS